MPNFADIIGRGFERLVRWAYPGLLFITLLGLGKPDIFDNWKLVQERLFLAVVVLAVAGFIIYALQRHVVNELGIWVLDHCGLSAFARQPKAMPYIDRLAQSNQRRFGYKDDTDTRDVERFSNYLMDRWAVVHAMGLTVWLLPIMYYFVGEVESQLRQGLPQAGLWLLIVLLSVGHVFGTILLERVELQYFPQASQRK
ncbi:MAG: hypothetical protein AAB037_04205 [Chloroflexota bacterium]|mgnify:FL=1